MPKPKKVGVNNASESSNVGRPTKKTDEIVEEILARLATGESIRSICSDEHLPSRVSVRTWKKDDKEFLSQYTQAREEGFDYTAEKLMEMVSEPIPFLMDNPKAANAEIQHRKLKADTTKWLLSKLCAKKYGDKLDVTSEQKPLTGFEIKGLNGDKL